MAITLKLEINNKPKKDGTCLIMLRITDNRKIKRISSGVFVKIKDFNKEAEQGKWIRRSNPNYIKLNLELEKFITNVRDIKNTLSDKKKIVSPKNIITEVKQKDTESFIEYFEMELKKVEKTKSYNFYRNSVSKLNNLKGYLKGEDLLFTEIDFNFLTNYEIHLREKGNCENTINTNLRLIRIFYYKAINEKELVLKNPFKIYKMSKVNTSKKSLNIEQIKQLEAIEFKEYSTLWNTKNFFLFCFYGAGVRVSDGLQLNWNNIENNKYLVYKMGKTKEKQFLELHPKALNILQFYKSNTSKPEDFIFPFLKNNIDYSDKTFLGKQLQSKTSMINTNLKKVAKLTQIEINLSSHISRHTSANNLRKSGASLYDISKSLLHSSQKITEIYLDELDNESTNKALMKALDY
jgi:site-specific recombinase XerD